MAMAQQTKRKRQTKHRGNAAGVVESRGRTGRRPTAAERSTSAREKAREKESRRATREQRYDRPPSWRGAFYRALAAAVAMAAACIFLTKNTALAAASFPAALAIYVPVSYYSDRWMYRRRLRKKRAEGVL
jgi:Flp pilus assembly protein TadB